MRWTEEDFAKHLARSRQLIAEPLPGKLQAVPGQPLRLTIRLPFKLPTWNALLAMDQWKRKKVRDWIHDAVSTFTPKESDSLTPMEYQEKRQLMASSIAGYYEMIAPKKSKKSVTAKNNQKTTKP